MSNLDNAESTVESFMIRVWQEEPGNWRGKVSHVQSAAQRGFTRLAQVMEFVEQQVGALSPKAAPEPSRRSQSRLPNALRWKPTTGLRLAGALAVLLVVGLTATWFTSSNGSTPFEGAAAVEAGGSWDFLIFLAGVFVGGAGLRLLFWPKQR